MRDTSFDSSNEKLDIFGTQDRSRSQSPSHLLLSTMKPKDSHFRQLNADTNLKLIMEKEKEKDLEQDYSSENFSESDLELFNTDEKQKFTNFNKVCLLPNHVHCKQKIMQNVERIKDDKVENFEEYYESIIESRVNLIKLSLTIFDEKNFNEINNSCHRLKEKMKSKHVKIPIMISLEYRIMRFDSQTPITFKKGEKANFAFFTNYNRQRSFETKTYMINNYDYMMANNLSIGDKIIIDFASAMFSITKIYYKNGKVVSNDGGEDSNPGIILSENNMEDHSKPFCINYEELENTIEENSQGNILDSSEMFFSKFLEEFYDNKTFKKIKNITPNMEIDFIEVVCNYDCVVNPNRPVQILKKLKNNKFDYVPDHFFIYGEKLIREVEFEYLVLDYINPEIYSYFADKIRKYNKKIPIFTKISDLYTLHYLDLIEKHSVGVIISFNNLIKELPFLDIVMMTEKLIKLFKKKGLAVYCHSQTLESLKKKSKPSSSDINDILLFLQLGVDGFNLGSETFFATNFNLYNSIVILREILTEFTKLLPAVKKLRYFPLKEKIEGKATSKDTVEISSISLYNSLRKNDHLILILISNDEAFLSHFLSLNLYNQIILVTNKHYIMKKFLIFSLTHCMLVKEIEPKDELNRDQFENDLVHAIREDSVVKSLNKRKDSSIIYVRCLKGENLETFNYYN